MEEVDSIIIHFLRLLNVNIDESAKNLSGIPVETIIEAAARCICAIKPGWKVPSTLPSGISQRIGVATQIAGFCKDLGYENDVGYQTFLYSNETELRRLFMYLIEKLPNEDNKVPNKVSPNNKKQMLKQQINLKIAEELNKIWIPPCCNKSLNRTLTDMIFNHVETSKIQFDSKDIQEKLLTYWQPKLISDNEKPNVNNMILPSKNTAVDSETRYESEKSLRELKETSIILKQKLDTLTSERNVMEVECSQALKNADRIVSDLKNIQDIMSSFGIDIDSQDAVDNNLLENVHKNIKDLHSQIEELTFMNLATKLNIEKSKIRKSQNESERNKCKKKLLTLKERAKEMQDECEKKENIRNQLKLKYEKLKGGNKRHIYTKRILEIIGNVEKQNIEIKKILDDSRHLQKEINMLEGQLERCFSLADETLFKDAKKDDQAKKAYKLLALLHSECNTIVSLVNDMGTLARDIVDLEDNIKSEKSKRTEDILQKIQSDLANLQTESK
ncbi:coiled-coil domain-containing protein 22 homolog [Leptidea sinapis]|uniref:coiled-coil domain-containing protein 22 homolog n=1 Tax=Leptidea sinapis TaxID=189913 RepID=UPI0021C4A542|nr:coiled-coil domain-containing protein 22 homolog [Leptidea sinapis]